jgi:hypothetical protein
MHPHAFAPLSLRPAFLAFSLLLVAAAPLAATAHARTTPADVSPNGTPEPSTSLHVPNLLMIPFAPPGNKDDQLDYATDLFSKKLAAQSLHVIVGPAMDVLDVASSTRELCRRYSVDGVLFGTVRHEQHRTMFMASYPSHAEVRVSRVSCDGRIVWKGLGVGDKTTMWSNPRSAETEAISNALDQIVTEFSTAQAN